MTYNRPQKKKKGIGCLTPLGAVLLVLTLIVAVVVWQWPAITGGITSAVDTYQAQQEARQAEAAAAAESAEATQASYEATQAAMPTAPPPVVDNTSDDVDAPGYVDPATGLPVVTVCVDAFAPYYTPMLASAIAADLEYGVNLEFVPFWFDEASSMDEAARSAALASGECDILFTTIDKPSANPTIGQLIAFSDETDGADKIICNDSVQSLNDLEGSRIAFLGESVGEFAVYEVLNWVQVSPTEVVLIPNLDGVAIYNDDWTEVEGGAVYEFIQGNVDCVSGWEPDVDEAYSYGGHLVFSTLDFRFALDVILASHNAVDNRTVETQAFVNAYFTAMRFLLEDPYAAETALTGWLIETGLDDWAYVEYDEDGNIVPGWWIGWLETTPQATLPDNAYVFRNLNTIADRMANACRTWQSANFPTPECVRESYLDMINPTFIQTAQTIGNLATSANPVNDSFVFTSVIDIPELTEEQLESATLLATLPFEKIPFNGGSDQLTDPAVTLLREQVLPIMQASPRLILRLTGSAALPSGDEFTLNGSLNFATRRANAVRQWLIDNGIDGDRIIIEESSDPTSQPCTTAEMCEVDRWVLFELLATGY